MIGVLHPLNRAARRLGVPARWLRAEAEAGRVPYLKAGSRLLFNVSAVSDVLARRAAETGKGVSHV